MVRICLPCRRPRFNSWVGKISWGRDRLPTPVFLGFPGGLDGKESACNAGDLGSTPGLGRSPGEGTGYPLQHSCLENPHGQRRLAGYSPWGHKEPDTTERPTSSWASSVSQLVKNLPANAGHARDTGSTPGWEVSLEEEMTTHSSILVWKIPRTEESVRIQPMGSQRVRHN